MKIDPGGAGEAPARSPLFPMAAAGGATTVVGIAWVGLSLATGLLYHLMPGATFLAGAWVFHETTRRAASRLEGVLLIGLAALVTATAGLIIASAGGTVGPTVETAVVVGIGLLLAARRLSRA